MWKDHLLSSCHEHFGTTSTRGKGRFRCLLLRAADETQLIAVLKCQLPQSLQVAVEALLARDAQLSTLPSSRRFESPCISPRANSDRVPIRDSDIKSPPLLGISVPALTNGQV